VNVVKEVANSIALAVKNARIQEELREYRKNTNLFSIQPLSHSLCWMKRVGVTDWNKKAEEVFGWSKDEVVGRNVFDFLIRYLQENMLKGF